MWTQRQGLSHMTGKFEVFAKLLFATLWLMFDCLTEAFLSWCVSMCVHVCLGCMCSETVCVLNPRVPLFPLQVLLFHLTGQLMPWGNWTLIESFPEKLSAGTWNMGAGHSETSHVDQCQTDYKNSCLKYFQNQRAIACCWNDHWKTHFSTVKENQLWTNKMRWRGGSNGKFMHVGLDELCING